MTPSATADRNSMNFSEGMFVPITRRSGKPSSRVDRVVGLLQPRSRAPLGRPLTSELKGWQPGGPHADRFEPTPEITVLTRDLFRPFRRGLFAKATEGRS